jgi:hypothetical protein
VRVCGRYAAAGGSNGTGTDAGTGTNAGTAGVIGETAAAARREFPRVLGL